MEALSIYTFAPMFCSRGLELLLVVGSWLLSERAAQASSGWREGCRLMLWIGKAKFWHIKANKVRP